jgi:hypothetical protein
MPATTINRLQTPLRQKYLRALSRNFRPLGKVAQITHGQRALRREAFTRAGIVLIEVNVKSIVNHTMELSQEAPSNYAATGGTPASGAATGGYSAWNDIDFAAVTVGQLITASGTNLIGSVVVDVP